MAILVTGGTGFVGDHLRQALLERGENLLLITRKPQSGGTNDSLPNVQWIHWDVARQPLLLNERHLPDQPIRAVINLMGEPIGKGRWTPEKRHRIRDSRVIGTRNLISGLIQSNRIPHIFLSCSAVGIYGDRGEEIITENTSPAKDFLAEVCKAWEAEADRITDFNARLVKFRLGVVLGREGGALREMLPLFRLGLGGRLGSGNQWFPWIHIVDLVRMILWFLDHETQAEVVNATAPNPVRNGELTSELAAAVRRPAFLHVPQFALRLALGDFAQTLLASQRVIPQVALDEGFQFQFAQLKSTVEDLVK